ncbi:siderophore-interacting protein [Deinococcus geothermalis]|uniref:Siderophore-interacting protein n=1 Tax=Deinococcus geothermalis (strain DSM 11300 / CIP 105573 / AG-3a) TaxID=319795 RepID=Q1J254_DEIGD|nr:siderophore-interacting protein [Deinococcus geothermalis]ABF44430.1 Siderophore-interacting protein [Deinococcus geothermalis DSM 11300]
MTTSSSRPTRPAPRLLHVRAKAQLTPNLLRLTLAGDLHDFGSGHTFKLLIVPRGTSALPLPDAAPRPVVRTFTVRTLDRAAGELTVDMVLHGGFAAQWAWQAEPGDPVGVVGPLGAPLPRTAGPYLIAGDHCALPAIARILEELPHDATGNVLIEVPGPADELPLIRPPGLRLRWLHRTGTADDETLLQDAVRALTPLPQTPTSFVWIACESASVKALRAYLREELGWPPQQMQLAGYWKRGVDERTYHDTAHYDHAPDEYGRGRG